MMNIHEFGKENNEIILLIPAIITKYLSMFRIWTRKFITGVQKNEEKERKQDIAYIISRMK